MIMNQIHAVAMFFGAHGWIKLQIERPCYGWSHYCYEIIAFMPDSHSKDVIIRNTLNFNYLNITN